MRFNSWWKRVCRALLSPSRPRKAGESTRRPELELLETRWLPANIYVTGSVTSMIVFTDPNRFNDGANTALTHLSGTNNYLALNLRSAVEQAQNLPGSNTIFLETNTYTLTRGELLVQFGPETSLTIKNMSGGSNVTTITRDSKTQFRLFEVDSGGSTTLENLELTNGSATAAFSGLSAEGGAILNHGNLTLTNDQFADNSATGYGGSPAASEALGGAIMNGSTNGGSGKATLTIDHSMFYANTAQGGSGADSVGNGAGGEGGAICLGDNSGAVLITASTFSNNSAIGGDGSTGGQGGLGLGGTVELAQTGIPLKVINSTFSGNGAYGGSGHAGANAYGGALLIQNQNQVNLVNDTIANNQTFGAEGTHSSGSGYGGGVANFGGFSITQLPHSFVNVVNTIIANNMADGNNNDLFGSYNSLGHNLIGAETGTGFTKPGDQTGTSDSPLDPGLDPNGLENNGGPTQTIALLPTSKAINAGDNGVVTPHSALLATLGINPLTTDQRGTGFARKVGPEVDIGAYEFQMNLNKSYSFRSSLAVPVTFSVSSPGLPIGSQVFPPPQGGTYQAFLVGSPPAGTTLHVNADGSFSITVPPGFKGTVQFTFGLNVETEDSVIPTNLRFTVTLQVTGGFSMTRP